MPLPEWPLRSVWPSPGCWPGGAPASRALSSARAADETKPVLLFVHGGPGMPEYFLDRTHPTGLEQDFVVAWWEQRGAGMSYGAGLDDATMTTDQLIDDVIAVADYLRTRFHQDRIYLMAHSWGSFIGIQAAARAP